MGDFAMENTYTFYQRIHTYWHTTYVMNFEEPKMDRIFFLNSL